MGWYADQQARALDMLRAAGGRPVTLRELAAAGVANPATLIYELELSGHQIEHVRERLPSGARPVSGYRLIVPAAVAAAPRSRWRRRRPAARQADPHRPARES